MAAMRAVIVAARDCTPTFVPEHHNTNKKLPQFTDEIRAKKLPSSNSRLPLQARDRNANMRVPPKAPLTTKNADGNMGQYDKQRPGPRPLTSTLSASVKSSNHVPLNPRVARSVAFARSVPVSRRDTLSTTVTTKTRENKKSTSVSALLNNITPKLDSRNPRVNSTSSTVSSLYNGSSNLTHDSDSILSHPETCRSGTVVSKNDRETTRSPNTPFTHSLDNGVGNRSDQVEKDSKFFFADEIKTVVSQPKPLGHTKSFSTSSYSNQEENLSYTKYSPRSSIGSVANEERSYPIFYHANGKPDLSHPTVANYSPSGPSSTLSACSRVTTPKLAGVQLSTSAFSSIQPKSVSTSRLNKCVSSVLPSPCQSNMQLKLNTKRRLNNTVTEQQVADFITESPLTNHGKTFDFDARDVDSSFNKSIDRTSPIDSTSSSSSLPLKTFLLHEGLSEINTTNEPQSPIKAGSTLEQLNVLASNARRERKVLDLEITNSSLAAINKTLERKMRKQTAELRRYRRLSRSGRLSIGKSSTTGLVSMETDQSTISDMIDEEKEEGSEDLDEEDESSEDEISDDGSLSPDALAQSDLRHRKNDEKRLQLDLAKHQMLLMSSQIMNQSLKRCLGLTEELIGEGLKALRHNVAVTDADLGGRVLSLDEMEDMENEGMSEVGLQILMEARQSALNGKLGLGSSRQRQACSRS
ncbi:hypothetical protein GcC1_032013 [Golovinomyces cichoracearum]|uniref:Uncharacterized protein n=1 Tax=Golovinomyces cichoracearum TaxID=62708 RepID=A0A420J222_9PEZI|nr:hypothetical protein GcC1_032013 [Golovinomyces cichoracearum]